MPVLSKKGIIEICGWIYSVWPSCVSKSQHASTGNSASWSLGHSSRSSFHRMAFSPSLKQNLIAYRSSKVSDCIFEIHQLWPLGFSWVYSNSFCSSWFEPEILKISQSSHKMYSNNILNFQESTTILNACTKMSGNLLKAPRIYTWKKSYKTFNIEIWVVSTHAEIIWSCFGEVIRLRNYINFSETYVCMSL